MSLRMSSLISGLENINDYGFSVTAGVHKVLRFDKLAEVD